MLSDILPPGVVVEETFDDLAVEPLFAEEEALLARSSARRRQEFAAVRACARRALLRFGHAPAPLLPGQGGAPSWPAGVVGSMTHCSGYRGAALASATLCRSIGVDVEPAAALPEGVLGLISGERERKSLSLLDDHVFGDRVLFSAKESVYKAWYPITGLWLNFRDATVIIDPDGTFDAEIHVASSAVSGFTGRWTVHSGLIATAVVG